MGRQKISIRRLTNDRIRNITFKKRRNGLIKKAVELSVLCDCEIAVVIFDSQSRLYQYGSHGAAQVLKRYIDAGDPVDDQTNGSILENLKAKERKAKEIRALETKARAKEMPTVVPAVPASEASPPCLLRTAFPTDSAPVVRRLSARKPPNLEVILPNQLEGPIPPGVVPRLTSSTSTATPKSLTDSLVPLFTPSMFMDLSSAGLQVLGLGSADFSWGANSPSVLSSTAAAEGTLPGQTKLSADQRARLDRDEKFQSAVALLTKHRTSRTSRHTRSQRAASPAGATCFESGRESESDDEGEDESDDESDDDGSGDSEEDDDDEDFDISKEIFPAKRPKRF
eukprot:m.184472 g.184472  ORF g.184472 m.184472 type:complete len:340 (-) comp53522_c0_seq3:2570-3589(-)